MDDINLKKEKIRKEYLLIRKQILNKDTKSIKIAEKVLNLNSIINANVIAIYKSLDSEVSTKYLIDKLKILKKTIVIPKVCEKELKFYEIDETKLIKSKFGVEEPTGNENCFSKDKIDIVIVPGICFDKEKNRLGFGKGYYDRFLSGEKINTIGICFEDQIYENVLPTFEFDMKVDMIVTENKIL